MEELVELLESITDVENLLEIIECLQEINQELEEKLKKKREVYSNENQSQELPENGFTYPAKSKRNDPYSI